MEREIHRSRNRENDFISTGSFPQMAMVRAELIQRKEPEASSRSLRGWQGLKALGHPLRFLRPETESWIGSGAHRMRTGAHKGS